MSALNLGTLIRPLSPIADLKVVTGESSVASKHRSHVVVMERERNVQEGLLRVRLGRTVENKGFVMNETLTVTTTEYLDGHARWGHAMSPR